jgi:hypothetical protein
MLQRHPAVLNLTGMALLPRGSRRWQALTTLAGIVLCTACANGSDSPEPGASAPRPEDVAADGCATGPEPRITGTGVGGLRIGDPAERILSECDVVADTTIDLEGEPQRVLRVDLGSDTVAAEIVQDSVWRITVESAGPATADGLRVGTPARRLAGLPDASVAAGEGRYYVVAPSRCGVSFGLGGLQPRTRGAWNLDELRELPDSIRVTRILVFGGCP